MGSSPTIDTKMKYCSGCAQEKSDAEFSKKGNGLQYRCRMCQRETSKQWYKTNRIRRFPELKANQKLARERNYTWVNELKLQKGCMDCGGRFHPWQLDFDHIGEDKSFNVSTAVAEGKSLNRIKLEVAKCELVCANCHRHRTYCRQNGGYDRVV